MVAQKYRWDFIGLSTDTKPTAETSEKVVNGSTYYCSDTSKLYVYCNGTWYERKPLGGTSNFNDLSNRPKYNGSEMTGSTNIPEVKSYTAGTNVSISEQNVISATDTTYTAGTNVSISDQNVISATDTTYSAFTGTDGTAAGVAGLVPAPATTDAGKYLKADGTWDTVQAGPTVVQTTGTSTTDVMSQNATTSMVFADPSTMQKVQIGSGATASGNQTIAIGNSAYINKARAIAVGQGAIALGVNSIALGAGSGADVQGQMDISVVRYGNYSGYNNSNYRLLTGLYDGQNDHDAATVGQIKMGVLSATPTGTTAGFPGRLYTYDSGGGTYEVYLCVHDNGDNTYVWKQVSLT